MFTAWLLRLLALLLLGGGGYALVEGSAYIVLDAGAAMVVAGTVAVAGGVVALGLAGAVARLETIRRLLAAPMIPPARDGAAGPLAPSPGAEPAVAAVEAALKADEIGSPRAQGKDDDDAAPASAGPDGRAEEAVAENRIKRTFTSGAGTYTMYENGRIEAILPEGRLDFASLDELRRHLDQRALTGDATEIEKSVPTP